MELGPDKVIPGICFASIKEGLPIKFGTSSQSDHWYDRGGVGRQVWAKPWIFLVHQAISSYDCAIPSWHCLSVFTSAPA